MTKQPHPSYIGRFAPSPTGLLHHGSLLTAVASFVDARAHQGSWLVRMEDLDPPREEPGAAAAIIKSLEAHGLEWDDTVLFQSQRSNVYQETLSKLSGWTYPCDCTRARLKTLNGIYDGHCRRSPAQQQPSSLSTACSTAPATALRIRVNDTPIVIEDLIQGHYQQQLLSGVGDFILHRKDGLFAYQLAVVADDIAQNITHIIRGSDLLDNTPRQCWLFDLLKQPRPVFGHLPVIVNSAGQKLSKQTFATPINNSEAAANIAAALHRLNHTLPTQLISAPCPEQLAWAIAHWQRERIPKTMTIASNKPT